MFPAAVSSSLSSSGLRLLGADGFGLHLLGSLQVVKGGTVDGPRVQHLQTPPLWTWSRRSPRLLTVAFAFVHFTDEKDGLLVDAHPVFVWPKQLLHVLFYNTEENMDV